MTDEGVADVEKGIHSIDECRTRSRNNQYSGFAKVGPRMGCTYTAWMIFDAGEDGSEHDRDEREKGAGSCKLCEGVERSWRAADPGDDGHDRAEANCADAVVRHRVQVLGAYEAVEALDEGVVEHEHDTCEPPGPALVPKEDLANVAHVLYFWVANAEFPALPVSC